MVRAKAEGGARVTPSAALIALLRRLAGASSGVMVSAAELAEWPAADVALLSRAGLLAEASAADRLQCPGCEQACAMPVDVVPRANRPPAVFIVCDKRDDIGMVTLAPEDLAQRRATRSAVALVLARLLGGADAVPADDAGAGVRVGVVHGSASVRPAFLVWESGGALLRLAGHELELALVFGVAAGSLALDTRQLVQCVNAPAGVDSGAQVSAEQRREQFVRLRDEEKERNPKRYLEAAAQRAGVSVYAFKQVVYRKPKRPSPLPQPSTPVMPGPVLKGGRKQR